MSSDAMSIDSEGQPMGRARSSSATAPKPKGILKNPSSTETPTLARPARPSTAHHERTSTADITAANTAYNTPAPTDPPAPATDPQPDGAAPTIAARRGGPPVNLTWDEENLQAAAAQGGGKMKITEPKTPYVRYNAETDQVENMDDIPNFDLAGAAASSSSSSTHNTADLGPAGETSGAALVSGSGSASALGAQAIKEDEGVIGESPRRPSAPSRSSSRSVSINSGSRRGSSSRRQSHGSEPVVDFETAAANGVGGSALDTSDAEDEDDESTWDPAKREQHEKFAALRHRHYSNEAEAMKRAQELMKKDEDEDEDEEEGGGGNGVAIDVDETDEDDDAALGASGSAPAQPNGTGKHKVPPPVPDLPAQYRS